MLCQSDADRYDVHPYNNFFFSLGIHLYHKIMEQLARCAEKMKQGSRFITVCFLLFFIEKSSKPLVMFDLFLSFPFIFKLKRLPSNEFIDDHHGMHSMSWGQNSVYIHIRK